MDTNQAEKKQAITDVTKFKRRDSLDQFHLKDKQGNITGVFDNAIFEDVITTNHMFIMAGVPYIYERGLYRRDQTGAILCSIIKGYIYPKFIKSNTLQRVYKLFLQSAELQVSASELNTHDKRWVSFTNGYYDPVTGKMIPHRAKYKTTYQIPIYFDPAAKVQGEHTEHFLQFAVPNPDDREMLLEFLGYCFTRDTSQQKFLMLVGEGGTGKSLVIKLIERALGADNVVNVPLEKLNTDRFAAYRLLDKLLNCCADLKTDAMDDVSILKQATGEDAINGEAKGKDSISFKSYAKQLFSANELPIVNNERTRGFFRRVLVLPLNNTPATPDVDLFDKMLPELPYFVHLCMDALTRMYQRGTILESQHSMDAAKQWREDSDSVEAFLAEETSPAKGNRVERGLLHAKYKAYCEAAERTPLQQKKFYAALRSKKYREERTSNARYFCDICIGKSVTVSDTKAPASVTLEPVDVELPF